MSNGDPEAESGLDTPGIANGTQSIRRSLAILRVLAGGGANGLRLMEVTRATGMNHATIHRILRVMLEEEIVEQDPKTRRYAIGEQIPLLALARPTVSPLQAAATPLLQRAAQEIGDTFFLTVRTGLETLCIARYLGSFPVQVLMIEVGARRPLGVSSAGVAMLSAMTDDQVHDILRKNESRFKPYHLSMQRINRVVSETRDRGYAVRQLGLVAGTKVVSVAICDPQGLPVGAVTIAAVDRRLTNERIMEAAAYLIKVVEGIRSAI